MRRWSRSIAVPLLALALGAVGTWLARAASSAVSIEAAPPNPVAGQAVLLRDASPDAAAVPGAWWDFGDGHSSESPAPSHVWEAPGEYVVRLVSPEGTFESVVVVSPPETLRLLAAHPFEVSVEARDPGTGRRSTARASAWTDRYGSFSFPEITGDPGNPEVTIKVLEAPEDGHYWFLWSGMTSFEYTVTIRELATGRVAVHRKEGPELTGGADTRSFPLVGPSRPSPRAVPPRGSTATASPVPGVVTGTPTRTRTASSTRTPTRTPPPTGTPTASATPTITPTPTITSTPTVTPTPTITPTPTPPFIALRAIQWQWNFCPSSDGFACPAVCPAPCGDEITLKVGQTYHIWAYNGDDPDVIDTHSLSSVTAIGLLGGDLPPGGSLPVQTITPMTPGDYGFNCTTFCGSQVGHDDMIGVIHVVP